MKQDGEWVSGKIRIPKGARLGNSTGTPGADSALLFDKKTGKTLGPAEVRVGEGSSLGEQILATAVTSAAALAIAHAPEIKERLQEDVIPAAKAKWDKFKAARKRDRSRGEIGAKDSQADVNAGSPATAAIPNPVSKLPKP